MGDINRIIVGALLATASLGCSSGDESDDDDDSSASVSGIVAGSAVKVIEQSSFDRNDASGMLGTEIRLASFAGLCALEAAGDEKAGGATLVIQLKHSQLAQLKVGSFTLVDGDTEVEYKKRDASCDDTKTSATSGTVTLTAVSGTEIDGSLDVRFGADRVSGSFAAPVCAKVPSNPGGSCLP